MAPISLKKGKIDEITKELVQVLAGLQPETENFNIALEFALSNFRFHRFLDVNSFDVARKFDGLREKFLVHCKEENAEKLKDLKESYLNKPFSNSMFEMRTESHYGVLSLLLNLSESPVNQAILLPKTVVARKESESFDWTEYLLDGEDKLSIGIPITDEQEQELELDDYYDYEEYSVGKEVSFREARSDDSDKQLVLGEYSKIEEEKSDYQWLQHNIIHQYWRGEPNFVFIKEERLPLTEMMNRAVVPIQESWKGHHLTENIVIRETIWMLQGVATTYVYSYVNGKFVIRDNITLSHVSQEMLYNITSEFAASGDKVRKLTDFVTMVSSLESNQLRTMRSFGFAMSIFLRKMRKELCALEFEIVNKDKPVTILQLKRDLGPLLSNIDLVFETYSSCITVMENGDMPANDSVLLIIDSLFETICRLDAFGSSVAPQVCVMLPILLETMRPFLNDLASWVIHGKLPRVGSREFFVCEDEEASKDDSEAWKHRFRIRHRFDDDKKLAVPQFLLEMADKILLTGKSCGILEQAVSNATEQESSDFEEEFLEALLNGLGISWKRDNKDKEVEFEDTTLIAKKFTISTSNNHQLLEENFEGVFLKNFAMFERFDNFSCKSNSIQDMIDKEVATLIERATSRPPLRQVFKSTLHCLINTRYTQTSRALLELLTVRFRFDDHFNTMKSFFLMEAGDVLNEFYSEIFAKIRAGDYWQSTSYLTSLLHDALMLRFPHLVNKLTVGIRTESRAVPTSVASSVQSVDVIYLKYAMKWPLTIIFDSKSEEKYNDVFSFLLQVKRALWSLEQLRIKDLGREILEYNTQSITQNKLQQQPIAILRQKLFILRLRLLHFIQSFHTYIMTRILHSSGLEFKAKLAAAKDFEEILTLHQEFLEKVYDRCLLSPKVGFAKEAITRILNLSLNFQRKWDLGLGVIKEDEVEAIGKEFDKCSHFIQSFLNNLIKRGSFPHLELLSLSLRI